MTSFIKGFLIGVLLFFLLFSGIWSGKHVIAESSCLEKGYPKTFTDYKFNSYCSNLIGNVTIELEKL